MSTYSYAVGALDIIDVETEEKISYNGLSDYTGDIVSSVDGEKVFMGSYGNSYYGKGGVYVADKAARTIDYNYYHQFGARRLAVSPENVFTTSTCVLHNGLQGSIYHRGIEVLRLNNESDELEFEKSFFLCYPHNYSMPVRLLYKKEY